MTSVSAKPPSLAHQASRAGTDAGKSILLMASISRGSERGADLSG
jgi:hypothetical protein